MLERSWLDLKRNCDYYFSRIINYPLAPPEHAYFALTSRCNLRCKMCHVSTTPMKEEDELTVSECKNIIDQIADLKINHLIFSGGEPLLRKDIFEFITYAVGKKIEMVDVITNGLLMDEKTAQELIRCGVTHITVSIDGLESADNFIRGKNSFQKAVKALDIINKYKSNTTPSVGINFTIMNCNIDHILPMIDLARSKKCNIIVFQPILPDNTNMQERNKDELWVSGENIPKLKELIKKVIELKKTMQDLSIHVNERILEMIPSYFSALPLDRNLKCYEGIVRIVISPNGDLWTCQGVYGNLRKSSLKDCWFSPEARKIRQEVKLCRNHCLQSCVHLSELSNIYPEIIKFKNLVNKEKDSKYLDSLFALLKEYKSCLDNRKKIDKKESAYY